MLAAVLFDFDGIIVDSEPMHYQTFRRVLEPLGKAFSWEEYCTTYIGFDDRDAFRVAFEAAGETISPEQLQALIQEKAALFQALVQEGLAEPLPGAVDLIRSLPQQLPLGLCSGALRTDIEPILNQLGILDSFHVIVTAEDTEKSKPDPAPYRLTLQKLGIEKAEATVAIEDTPAGIRAATGAGMKVLAVTNSYDPSALAEADAVTDSLETTTYNSLENLVL